MQISTQTDITTGIEKKGSENNGLNISKPLLQHFMKTSKSD